MNKIGIYYAYWTHDSVGLDMDAEAQKALWFMRGVLK